MSAPKAPRIERSAGIAVRAGMVTYGIIGNGYGAASQDLDATVERAAKALAAAYGREVTIRFNSNGTSGGVFLRLDRVERVGSNAQVGIVVDRFTEEDRKRLLSSLARYPSACEEVHGRPLGIGYGAHLQATVMSDPRALAGLPGWHENDEGGYHHGASESVEAALALLLEHAPAAEVGARNQRASRRRRQRARRAAARSVHKRTFAARKAPKGSAERARLNEDPRTSEYMPSMRWCVIAEHLRQSCATAQEALAVARRAHGL